jgi:uncharacterized membrane protein YcjF (UPF0283 family)
LALAAALLAAVAVALVLASVFAFINFRSIARTQARETARQAAEEIAEVTANQYIQKNLPDIFAEYASLMSARGASDAQGNEIAEQESAEVPNETDQGNTGDS